MKKMIVTAGSTIDTETGYLVITGRGAGEGTFYCAEYECNEDGDFVFGGTEVLLTVSDIKRRSGVTVRWEEL